MTAPKKPRSKAKKINLNSKDQWEQILKTVTKNEVPVQFLKSMTVNLADGTKVDINVKELLDEGHDPFRIEERINERLDQLDAYIKNVDLYICVDTVAGIVEPISEEILKNI